MSGATRLGEATLEANRIDWFYVDSTLAPGATASYTVVVEDGVGNEGTPSIAFSVAAGTNADLAGLSLTDQADNAIPLTQTFDSTLTAYTTTVANSVPMVTVTPTLADTTADTTAGFILLVDDTEVTSPVDLTSGDTVITVRVTADDGVTIRNYIVTITRADALTYNGETIANQEYTFNATITPLTLPEAIGGIGTLSYALTPAGAIPAGLTFTPANRTLSGTPGAATTAAATLAYTVTDSATLMPETAALTFTVTVAKGGQAAFLFPDTAVSKTVGDPVFTVTPTGGSGNGAVTYSSDTPVVASVEAISGDVTVRMAGTAIIAATKAANANYNEAVATYTLTVTDPLVFVVTSIDPQSYRVGTDVSVTLPDATGGTGTLSYTLTPDGAIPAGLTFNPADRILTGTPNTATTTAATLAYTVTDSATLMPETAALTFTVTVDKGDQPEFVFPDATVEKRVRR